MTCVLIARGPPRLDHRAHNVRGDSASGNVFIDTQLGAALADRDLVNGRALENLV